MRLLSIMFLLSLLTSSLGFSETFTKYGNNGTVAGVNYCAMPQFAGRMASCEYVIEKIWVGSELKTLKKDCWTVLGLNDQRESLDVVCSTDVNGANDSLMFYKSGNNGTVSCKTFCEGADWGAVGACRGAYNNSAQGTHPEHCKTNPGYLGGAELSCYCSNRGNRSAP